MTGSTDTRPRQAGWRLRWRVWLRLLLIQTAFCPERMQSRGFLYALLPGTARLQPEELAQFMRRHHRFFNAHPWMTGWAVGLQLHALERDEDVASLLTTLVTPLGAIGDRWFWQLLKPLSALPACLGALGGIFGFSWLFWSGLCLSTLMVLLPSFYVRRYSLTASWRRGRESIRALFAWRDSSLFGYLQITGALLLGVLLAWFAAWQQGRGFSELLLLAGSALLYAILARLRLGLALRLSVTVAVAALAAILMTQIG